MTKLFVEQPLALPGSAKKPRDHFIIIPAYFSVMKMLDSCMIVEGAKNTPTAIPCTELHLPEILCITSI